MSPKKNQSLKRVTKDRDGRLRFLIYCEDTYASPQYFEEVAREVHREVNINLGPQHGEPFTLVGEAAKHQQRAPTSREDNRMPYDEVWCIIDVEAPKPHAALEDALKEAGDNGIHVALANPCFAAWALMHVARPNAYMTTSDAERKLAQYSEVGYSAQSDSRNRKQLNAGFLVPLREKACQHAKQLRQQLERPDLTRCNPATNLDILIEILYESEIKAPTTEPGLRRCVPTGTKPRPKRR